MTERTASDDREALMADMLLALNWARVVLKNQDRSEWEQRGYDAICSIIARAEKRMKP
jgi:hypothetical protein